MATVELNELNFEDIIIKNDIVIVDFWAPWCGPCQSFAPVYEQAAVKFPDVVFAKVNTEEQQALAAHFQIRSIPTLMVFREQIILYARPGALPPTALEQVVTKTKELDMAQVRRDIESQASQQEPG